MKSWRFDRSDPMESRGSPIQNPETESSPRTLRRDPPSQPSTFRLWCYTRRIRVAPAQASALPSSGTRVDDRGEASETHEMTILAHARPRRGGRAPARERPRVDARETSSLGRADRDRVTSARLVGGVAIALLVACVGAFGSIAVAARAGGAAGAVVTSTSALGSVTPRDSAVDPLEASGARPMSAYGTIDEHSPVMRALGEDPVEAAAAAFLDDATLGERERPGRDDASSDAAPRDPPARTDPSRQMPSSPASVQADVDSQIEIEMRRLDEAARAMDAERATRRARDERTAAEAGAGRTRRPRIERGGARGRRTRLLL